MCTDNKYENHKSQRFNELSPKWDRSAMGKQYISSPAGDKYADFIVNTVKPYIDEHYNTKPQCRYTGIGGSSMGGIISLYMAIEYSEVFDYGIVFSPAMHVYADDILDKFFNNYDFKSMKSLPRIYLFAGGETGGSDPGTPYDETCITKYVDIIKDNLVSRNYPEQMIGTMIDKNLSHIESTWAKIFPNALKWLSDTGGISGDVNGDGILNIRDATEIQKYNAELVDFNEIQLRLGDLNNDGRVNISDATLIQKRVAEIKE